MRVTASTLFLLAMAAAPLQAQARRTFAYDPDFAPCTWEYDVSVRSDLPGLGRGLGYAESLAVSRTADGEIHVVRSVVPLEGAPAVPGPTYVYDREWNVLRVEGIRDLVEQPLRSLGAPFDRIAPETGATLERILGPVALDVARDLASPAGSGSGDPADFVVLSPVRERGRSKSTTRLGAEQARIVAITAFEVVAIEPAGDSEVCRVRWTNRFEHEGLTQSILPAASIEIETCLHSNGLPTWSRWTLRVGTWKILEMERTKRG